MFSQYQSKQCSVCGRIVHPTEDNFIGYQEAQETLVSFNCPCDNTLQAKRKKENDNEVYNQRK